MKLSRITFLCFLPTLFAVDVVAADEVETLIVGPGERLSLEARESGLRFEAAIDGGPMKPGSRA